MPNDSSDDEVKDYLAPKDSHTASYDEISHV
jgi:hypothetical protein